MKKLFVLLVAVSMVIISVIPVFAQNLLSFKISDAECDKNRLFEVPMLASGDVSLCAASFEITYDTNMFEFKKISCDNAKVDYNDAGGNVFVSYLASAGKDVTDNTELFEVQFKSINIGEGIIDFSASDCVDSNAEFIEIGKCTSSKIIVGGLANNNENGNDGKSKSADSSAKDKVNPTGNRKDSEYDAEESETQGFFDNLGLLNGVNDNNTVFLIFGVVIGVSTIVIVFVIFLVVKRLRDRNKNKKIKVDE